MLNKFKLLLISIVLTFASINSFAEMGSLEEYVPNAQLVGSVNYTFFFMKIFKATTYAPDGKLLLDKPFALQLEYNRNIEGDKIVKKTIEEISNQKDKVSDQQLEEWKQELSVIIPTVQKGTVLTGIYTQNQETLFFDSNWRLLGKISGQDFAKHFFGIWLGSDSSEPKLTKKLLGLN